MSEPQFVSATDAMASWWDEVSSGKPPVLYLVGTGALKTIQIGPGLVTLIGGAPGAGKTALAMQMLTDALRLSPTLRAVACNVEMPPSALLDRQLARLSGIDLSIIRRRQLTAEHVGRIDAARMTLDSLAERLCFVRPPFALANIAAVADAFRADLLLLDYLQRIVPPGKHADKRLQINSVMDSLRLFADAGAAVLAVAAVGRIKDGKGRSSYDPAGLGLASFKESGELEYGCDSAYLLGPDGLRCVKDRYGEPHDIPLVFDRPHQQFSVAKSAIEAAWENTP
jgi:replicative DNA helicase